MRTEDILIPNIRGLNLAASFDMPDEGKEIKAYAVYAHCFTCSKELKAISNINKSLTDAGIAVLRFDMTGIGSSEGNFIETNFTTQLEDFSSVVDYLVKSYQTPTLYIGHSLGGTVALFSAMRHLGVKAVVTIASPCEPANLAKKLANTRQRAIDNGIGETDIGGVTFQFKPDFFDNLEKYNLESEFINFNKPYLVLHSPVDTYTDFENAEILYGRAKHPKAIISLDDIDHLMLKKEDAFYVGKLIAVWSEKYL